MAKYVETKPALVMELDEPVATLAGFRQRSLHRAKVLTRLFIESAPLVIIAGFFWIGQQVTTQMSGLPRTLVQLLVVAVEFALISAWNVLRIQLGSH